MGIYKKLLIFRIDVIQYRCDTMQGQRIEKEVIALDYRRFVKSYVILHIAVLLMAVAVLFTLRLPMLRLIGVCPMKLLFRIYCPFCGGTRAAAALLCGDLLTSLRLYPLLPVYIASVAYFEVYALRALLLRDPQIMRRARLAILLIPAALTAVFFVLRNILLFYGIDPIGELA